MTEETKMTVELLERILGEPLDKFFITTVNNGFIFMGKFYKGFELIEIVAGVPDVAKKLAEPIE